LARLALFSKGKPGKRLLFAVKTGWLPIEILKEGAKPVPGKAISVPWNYWRLSVD